MVASTTARKLVALGVDGLTGATAALQRAISDERELHALLVWLDDTAFHRMSELQRQAVVAKAHSDEAIVQWLQTLGSPFALTKDERELLLDWVVGQAVLAKHAAQANAMDMDSSDSSSTPVATAASLEQLCLALDVPVSNDPDAACKALSDVLRRNLHHLQVVRAHVVQSIALAAPSAQDVWTGEPFPLGFDTKDPEVNKIATVLRMLYIGDLRELQWHVNEVIAICQSLSITALNDPKANLSLSRGRHGR